MKHKSVKYIYQHGKPEDFTPDHLETIVRNLYTLGIAEIFFIGMGWPEGYRHCESSEYVKKTLYLSLKRDARPYWFACRYL